MRHTLAIYLLLSTCALGGTPALIDGLAIPDDFGTGAREALQTNVTSWGKSFGQFYCGGSELDRMWVCQDDIDMYIGLTGNLATNGNVIMVFIQTMSEAGQNPLMTGLCEGPPYALQDLGAAYLEPGVPEDPLDDYYTREGRVGAHLDPGFSPSYVIAVDLHDATMHASLYHLHSDVVWEVSPYDHPDTEFVELLDVYTTRCFLGQNTVNNASGILEWGGSGFPETECSMYAWLEYWRIAFDDRNIEGVTDLDASDPSSATLGLEIRLPMDDLLLSSSEDIQIMALVTGSGEGAVSNQSLPPMQPDALNWEGRWPQIDFGDETGAGWDGPQYATVDLSMVYVAIPPVVDGVMDDSAYDGATLVDTQVTPTGYGDQTIPDEVEIIPGNELDSLYVTNDADNLYVGITGTIDRSGNHLVLFVDMDSEAGESQLVGNECWNIFSGEGCDGMNGHTLPLLPDDETVYYDYAYSLHVSGDWRHVVGYDLRYDVNTYIGGGPANGDGTLEGGFNPNGVEFAYNWTDLDLDHGVPFCSSYDYPPPPCFEMTVAEVETYAETMTTGFEVKLPFAELGIDLAGCPCPIHLWAIIVNTDGEWISDQSLPSLRNDSDSMMYEVGGEDDIEFTRPLYEDPNRAYDARAAAYVVEVLAPDGDFDGDGDVDLVDACAFQRCFGATGIGSAHPECLPGDMLMDDMIDLSDYATWATLMTGPF